MNAVLPVSVTSDKSVSSTIAFSRALNEVGSVQEQIKPNTSNRTLLLTMPKVRNSVQAGVNIFGSLASNALSAVMTLACKLMTIFKGLLTYSGFARVSKFTFVNIYVEPAVYIFSATSILPRNVASSAVKGFCRPSTVVCTSPGFQKLCNRNNQNIRLLFRVRPSNHAIGGIQSDQPCFEHFAGSLLTTFLVGKSFHARTKNAAGKTSDFCARSIQRCQTHAVLGPEKESSKKQTEAEMERWLCDA